MEVSRKKLLKHQIVFTQGAKLVLFDKMSHVHKNMHLDMCILKILLQTINHIF
jgi:hypothetical protein